MRIYEYKNCSTCQKALKFLDARKLDYDKRAIVEQPPSLVELKQMLAYLKARGESLKNLFNTSGVQYRELGIAEKLKSGMTESEALKLLSQNGKLVKRPFLLGDDFGLVGFKAEIWEEAFSLPN